MRLTITLIVAVSINQRNLYPLIQEASKEGEILPENEVSSRHECCPVSVDSLQFV